MVTIFLKLKEAKDNATTKKFYKRKVVHQSYGM